MTTKSIRPVPRETSALVRERGMRPMYRGGLDPRRVAMKEVSVYAPDAGCAA